MLDALKKILSFRGNWVPQMPLGFRTLILVMWAIEPITRGIDYITGDRPGTTTSLSAVEGAFPLWVWGTFCLVGGCLILGGFATRWRTVTIAGLHITGATYFALAIGLSDTAISRGGDGFRTPVMFFVFALTFWASAIGYAVLRRDRLVVITDVDGSPDAKALDGSPTTHNG